MRQGLYTQVQQRVRDWLEASQFSSVHVRRDRELGQARAHSSIARAAINAVARIRPARREADSHRVQAWV